jgi:hypothetical protein
VYERKSALETDLIAALVAILGNWDPELCEFLADHELCELIRPEELLKRFAMGRNWQLNGVTLDEQSWSQGKWQTYLGKEAPHTCLVAALNGSRSIDHMIWKAEVMVLMPYIEERRQRLIEDYRLHFRLPHTTKFGSIDDIYDLEVAHIESQLRRVLSKNRLEFVQKLREARNSLSHLRPVEPEVLTFLCGNR